MAQMCKKKQKIVEFRCAKLSENESLVLGINYYYFVILTHMHACTNHEYYNF